MAALFATVPIKSLLGQGKRNQDPLPGANPHLQNDGLSNYSKASFQSYLNSIFELHTVNGVVPVALLEVGDLPASKGGECFSLLFRGGSRALRQDTYTIEHPSLGTFELFLVPTGADENGAQGYLATINRLSYAQALNNQAPVKSKSSGQQGAPAKQTISPNPAATPAPTVTPATVQPAIEAPSPPKRGRKRHRRPTALRY